MAVALLELFGNYLLAVLKFPGSPRSGPWSMPVILEARGNCPEHRSGPLALTVPKKANAVWVFLPDETVSVFLTGPCVLGKKLKEKHELPPA